MAAAAFTDDGAFVSLSHADEKLAETHSIEKKSLSTAEPTEAFPSEEDQLHLRRVADAIPWKTYLIAYIELAERFSYYVRR